MVLAFAYYTTRRSISLAYYTRDYGALPRITAHYRALPRITAHYRAWPRITAHYRALPRITAHYRALPRITAHYRALPRITAGLMFKPERKEGGDVAIGICEKTLHLHRVILAAFGVEPSSPCQTQVHHINKVRHYNGRSGLRGQQPEQEDERREEVQACPRQAGIRSRW
jgi:hypothetical protein